MTICAALRLKDKILVGSDSLLSQGYNKSYLPSGKLIEIRPNFIIAWSGISTISHCISQLKNKKRVGIPKNADQCFKLIKPIFEQYKVTIEACLNFNKKENYSAELLIVANDKIFCCDEFSCEEYETYAAVGSGKDKSLGSFFADHKKEKSLTNALNCAIFNDVFCGGNIVIKELLLNKEEVNG